MENNVGLYTQFTSDILAIVSLVLTIIGFVITFITLYKTKNSIKIAKESIDALKERVIGKQIALDIQDVVHLLEQLNYMIEKDIKNPQLNEHCDNVKKKLIILVQTDSELLANRLEISNTIVQIKTLRTQIRKIQKLDAQDIIDKRISKLIEITSNEIDKLVAMLAQLNNKSWRSHE